jgi:hypothetical protein
MKRTQTPTQASHGAHRDSASPQPGLGTPCFYSFEEEK